MTKLSLLRSRLNALRRRRQLARWGIASSAVALVVLWLLGGAFLADWLLNMSRPQRFVSLLLVLGVSAWVFVRYALPWLRQSEDELDVALLVERHHGIDSDLVAALQFQGAGAAAWGSPQLETAVIDYVEEFSPSLNVAEGFRDEKLRRRLTLLGVTAVVALLAVVLFPGHAAAFFNRFLLGSAHYPTKTGIDALRVNGEAVADEPVRIPYGRPIVFEVDASGELPEDGSVTFASLRNEANAEVPLEQVSSADGKAVYRGELPRLVDSVRWQVTLGDAYTDPREITLIPLPAVSVHLTPVPPEYARTGGEAESAADGNLQAAVLEGSEVKLRVASGNKDLKKAVVTIGETEYPLAKSDEAGREWTFAGDGHPLAHITEPVRYSVQVEDADGLSLEKPIQGYIRLRADRAPRITRFALPGRHKRVLPTAQIELAYGAADDYGLSGLKLLLQAKRKTGETFEAVRDVNDFAPGSQSEAEGRYALDLAKVAFEHEGQTVRLDKDDEITLTLRAADYRGQGEPQSGQSDPIVLPVTDMQGILAGMLESDEKSAEQLDTTIRIELGIGDTK